MNQPQRKFLIDKVLSKGKKQLQSLRNQKIEFPSASNYIFKAILNDELELQDETTIMDALRSKAMAAREGENWLSSERMGYDKETIIKMPIESLIIIPKDYEKECERVRKVNGALNEKIKLLTIQLETMEVRIQLASDRTLQNMISEVDDMGDLSLIDTKIKLID